MGIITIAEAKFDGKSSLATLEVEVGWCLVLFLSGQEGFALQI